ncbi:uncharacterized protein [Miscanthus floridulus]|uniref:uncharacterized protein n=1 Tax=Miscanthus floridulus TaxID=154761 RepID=UPI00345797E9
MVVVVAGDGAWWWRPVTGRGGGGGPPLPSPFFTRPDPALPLPDLADGCCGGGGGRWRGVVVATALPSPFCSDILIMSMVETDKASMLEEIIEYVKFFQLQVKVLSMSRLGTTEAVIPLLTES